MLISKMPALNRRQPLSVILIYMRSRRKSIHLRNKAIAILVEYEEKRRIITRQSLFYLEMLAHLLNNLKH